MKEESLLVAMADLRRLDKKIFITENLLTRAFVVLLRNDDKVLRSYLRYLGLPYSPDLTIQDQVVDGDGRIPDIQIASASSSVFVLQENKIDSPEGPNQRRDYLRTLRNNPAKHRLLVYVAPRNKKRPIQDSIRQRFITWDEIYFRVQKAPCSTGRQRWLRQEFLSLLEDRNMASPHPINMRRLAKAWIDFNHAKTPLKRIFYEVKNELDQILNGPGSTGYKIRLDEEDYSLSIKKEGRGPLIKAMQDEVVWVWIGISSYQTKLYLSLEIGFVEDTYGDRTRHFRKKALKCNFIATNYTHDKYDCEGYEKYRDLAVLLKDKQDFRKQLAAVLKWVSRTAQDISPLLKALEKDLEA